ncbi:hypothetical protein [Winogradskya humida]|uniref:Repeat protein (TIGR01451 family) n=1 Tax=Winogradskya humida TaxID=113566 RepID=A0ABQ3ZRX4_9ACTN|nr:hypothetical protein [Actinoplanes humidus]GIE21325.1 hypothetical protein Ahu01nite_044270 [Actinoplanes humidus]
MRKLDRRGKVILGIAAAAAVLANAGVAWAYWSLEGAGSGVVVAGSAVALKLEAHSDDSRPLYPGGTANLTVTVANQNDFPIRITAITPDPAEIMADTDHRENGCLTTGVVVSADVLNVSWQVPKNTIGVFTVPNGLRMTNDSDSACQGATFTIPVRADGQSSES